MSDEDLEKSGEDPNAENKELGDDPENLGGEDDLSDEDLAKPITKKDLLEFQKENQRLINNRFANKRHEDKSKNYKPDPNKSGKDDENPLDSRLSAVETFNAKLAFATEHGLNAKEVEMVWKLTGGKPNAKTLENPFIKGGLEKMRSSTNLRDNTPSGSGSSSFQVDGKKWDDLTPQERQKNFPARMKAIIEAKKK